MSASTVSITANHTTKRRPAVAGDDLNSPISAFGKTTSHSFSTESALLAEKTKKPSSNSLAAEAYGRRTHPRKADARPERPKWATVVSVLTKNLLLLVLLIGLVQFVRNLVYNSGSDEFSVRRGSEFERRIADVEGMLKKATKMLQVQVEVVDKKLENGLVSVKTDLIKKIDDKNSKIANKLKKFDGRIEGLERASGELRADEWLKKGDFEGFFEEFRKKKGGDGKNVDLDEVREVARGIVERELGRHAADGLGWVDYAVVSGGAAVVKHSEEYGFGKGIGFFNRVKNGVHFDAVKMISPSFGEPGQCFALKGSEGFVEIKLRTAIIPEAVTLEHVAKSVAFDRSSAPKDCRISCWLQKHDSTDPEVDTGKMNILSEFKYDLEKSNAQTFDVLETPVVIDTIRLDFTSNHGNPAHTCIYRLRVHGREPDSIPMLDAQS